jgi:hypothetical protein
MGYNFGRAASSRTAKCREEPERYLIPLLPRKDAATMVDLLAMEPCMPWHGVAEAHCGPPSTSRWERRRCDGEPPECMSASARTRPKTKPYRLAGWKRCKPNRGAYIRPRLTQFLSSFTLALALITVSHRAIHLPPAVLHIHRSKSASIHTEYRLPSQVRGGIQGPTRYCSPGIPRLAGPSHPPPPPLT